MTASTAVMVRWLVTVNGCTPGTIPNGIIPMKFAIRMNMNSENTKGTYFLPSGPTLEVSILLTKPATPSTAICQRPGTSSRFIPPHMNSHKAPNTRIMNNEEFVKETSYPAISSCASGSIWNWCIGSILPLSPATFTTLFFPHPSAFAWAYYTTQAPGLFRTLP